MDQRRRRVGNGGQPLGQLGPRTDCGLRNQSGQNAVEQTDVLGPEMIGALHEQFGDLPDRLRAALRIATFNDVIEPGDQRSGG